MDLYILGSNSRSEILNNMVLNSTKNLNPIMVDKVSELSNLQGKKLLFAIELNNIGVCYDTLKTIEYLQNLGSESLINCTGALLIHGPNELYTKNFSREIIFLANSLGCAFIGHPLVEAIGNLKNFLTWQKTMDMTLEEICYSLSKKLVSRLVNFTEEKIVNPNILALHSSSYKTSNTLSLWNLVKNHLPNFTEFHVENGTVLDCTGCSFKTCMHYSEKNSCFYGGVMVEEIYPSIERAHSILFLCPNYNDAISANLSAVINRLTALYRKHSFYEKNLFSIVVSGNSGSDIVAKQLLGALNINKGFRLPPYFSLMGTANEPKSILNHDNIKSISKDFSSHILNESKRQIFT
jgi:multimeric flavodoxin WrbA